MRILEAHSWRGVPLNFAAQFGQFCLREGGVDAT